MIRIYEVLNPYMFSPEYVYLSDDWVSSNFDSLQQLFDVGFDDIEKRQCLPEDYDDLERWDDVTFLIEVESFDDADTLYPELFI